MDATTTVYEKNTTYVMQRIHNGLHGDMWVDSSQPFYGDTGKEAAMDARDTSREIFGTDKVRVVQRDLLIIETPVD